MYPTNVTIAAFVATWALLRGGWLVAHDRRSLMGWALLVGSALNWIGIAVVLTKLAAP